MTGYEVKQSSASYPLVFMLIQSADHITGLTGATPTVTISKAGGAFASPAGAVSEIGSGWYKVAGNASDTGALGPLVLHATAAGADPTDALYPVVAVDPQDAAAYGLSRLDASVSSRSTYAGADTSGTTTLLSRLTSGRAGNLDNLDATVSSRLASASYTAAPTTAAIAAAILATPDHLLATDAAGAVTAGTVADKAGYALSSAGMDQVVVEAGLNARQTLSIIAAACAGTGGTASSLYKGAGVATTRITFAAAGGERSSVTLSPPA